MMIPLIKLFHYHRHRQINSTIPVRRELRHQSKNHQIDNMEDNTRIAIVTTGATTTTTVSDNVLISDDVNVVAVDNDHLICTDDGNYNYYDKETLLNIVSVIVILVSLSYICILLALMWIT
ncbi:hypothetical protein GE061_008283 [Apolygus lucorum]|uniref:Uncharacterized protein n=1 Tax=Apolygus lucorum TaxID=248454 RepID=A0A6A4IYN9_APOLU|nr:hypothetical protein GE061_008283 [Apolygus lucorum]